MTTNTTALARRFRLDVTNDLTLAGGWVEAKGMFSFKPEISPNLVETSAYDSDGWESREKTMQGWTLAGSFWLRAPLDVFDAGVSMLRDRQTLWGDACRIGVRWYDKNGADEAWAGVALVDAKRGNDGVADPESADVTLTGDGALTAITNPGVAPTAPTVLSASPSAAAQGEQVLITGTAFQGATGVKFGATNASDFTVVSDQVIVASVPAGTAGAANITVTNAVGTSTAFSYTRGA